MPPVRAYVRRLNDPFVAWVISVFSGLYLALQLIQSPFIREGLAKLPWLQWLHPIPIVKIADFLQVFAMALLLGPCSLVQPKMEGKGKQQGIAVAASNQFRDFWVWLIASWLLFYLVLLIRPDNRPVWDAIIDTLNNLQGVFLFLCYWVLTTITVAEDGSSQRPSPSTLLVVAAALFLVADLSWPPGDQTRMIFRLLSGLWVGVAMGLLIGCLESEYLHVRDETYQSSRRFFIGFFYLYAVLQVAYVGFGFRTGAQSREDLALVERIASFLSLPLKLLFIGMCYWLLRQGRFEFYMKKTREAIENADAEWKQFSGANAELPTSTGHD